MTDPESSMAAARTEPGPPRAKPRRLVVRAWLVAVAFAVGLGLWWTLDLLEPVSGVGKLIAAAGVAVCCAILLLARDVMPRGKLMDAFFTLTCMVAVSAIVTHVLIRFRV